MIPFKELDMFVNIVRIVAGTDGVVGGLLICTPSKFLTLNVEES